MHFNFASIVAFAASAVALTVTNPSQGDKVDFSKPVDVKWRSVENDPKNITLELVNMSGTPNVNKQIAEGVKASEGHYKIDKLWGIPVAEGYQINIVAEEGRNTGILAQSQQFNVTRVADPPKTSKRDSIIHPPTIITKTVYSTATPSRTAPSCTARSTTIKPSSRPCIKHFSSAPPLSSTSTSISVPSESTATSSRASATETAPAATSSTAGSAALGVPAAGSLAMGLLALMV